MEIQEDDQGTKFYLILSLPAIALACADFPFPKHIKHFILGFLLYVMIYMIGSGYDRQYADHGCYLCNDTSLNGQSTMHWDSLIFHLLQQDHVWLLCKTHLNHLWKYSAQQNDLLV